MASGDGRLNFVTLKLIENLNQKSNWGIPWLGFGAFTVEAQV